VQVACRVMASTPRNPGTPRSLREAPFNLYLPKPAPSRLELADQVEMPTAMRSLGCEQRRRRAAERALVTGLHLVG
jgi:hypothetical protein